MNYEKKLALAKEALESGSYDKETIEYLFPELKKESEDEKIKRILHSISSKMSFHLTDIFTDEEFQCFDTWSNAWLENQGEQKPIIDGILTATNYDKLFQNCRVNKFNIGDWIVWKDKNYIVNYNGCGYELFDQNGLSTSWDYKTIEDNAHLWTIQDAKDGDVLATPNYIYIFNSIYKEIETVAFYCLMKKLDEHFSFGDYKIQDEILNSIPATKKQRDLLFQKMKEAGYKWDGEKKELRKIHVIDEGKAEMDYCFTKMMNGEKISPVWSEEDSRKIGTLSAIIFDYAFHKDALDENNDLTGDYAELNKWLQSFPERFNLQSKQDWSEEDEEMFKLALKYLKQSYYGEESVVSWLKSLKDRYTWKPSEEQMNALDEALSLAKNCGEESAFDLRTLYEQLKKLKEK